MEEERAMLRLTNQKLREWLTGVNGSHIGSPMPFAPPPSSQMGHTTGTSGWAPPASRPPTPYQACTTALAHQPPVMQSLSRQQLLPVATPGDSRGEARAGSVESSAHTPAQLRGVR
mmetsp:Transcript_37350/g.74621  ORF Transcript_37350/g.74621 Transcript_37350/m.74621 type:complete len:116 (-) Transcript_37350:397-744(-)